MGSHLRDTTQASCQQAESGKTSAPGHMEAITMYSQDLKRSLNKNGPRWIVYSNAWAPVGRTTWVELSKEVCH